MDDERPAARTADVLDVHILDIAAQIEALLRGAREVQRGVLALRGVTPLPLRNHGASSPAEHIHSRLQAMVRDSEALRDAIDAALTAAAKVPIGPTEPRRA